MRITRGLAAISLLTLACSSGSDSPAATASVSSDQVDALFASFTGAPSPGAAIAVVHEGEIVYRNGYGFADLEHGIPITPSTVFDIASLSKQFTGMAVAMLVEEGHVSLEDDIRTFLPEMPDFGPTVTLDHLVHHTSGIRDWPGTLAVAGWLMDDVISFDQILRMARTQRDLNFAPGAEYSYSNTGYNLLAETVARVSGETFRGWTAENMFDPLEMSRTHFHDDHTEIVPGRALGYQRVGEGYRNVANGLTALGSSSLYTTVEDLARWIANFDDGRVGGRSVLERMQQQGQLNDGRRIPYAFGQSRGEHRGLETWSHTGSWAGFRTFLIRFPRQQFGVVILSNLGSYDPTPTAFAVADLYLVDAMQEADAAQGAAEDGRSAGREASAVDVDRASPARRTPPGDELGAFTGEFYSPELDATYRLSVVNGVLVARHWRHGEIELTPVLADEFRGDRWFAPSVRFERDARGRVSGLLITQDRSRNMKFEKRE